MKRILLIVIILFLAACGGSMQDSPSVGSGPTPAKVSSALSPATHISGGLRGYREGEILVKFRAGTVGPSTVRLHEAMHARVLRQFAEVPGLERIQLTPDMSVAEAVVRYSRDPSVEYAEPNYLRHVWSTVPNDPLFPSQWALMNTGAVGGAPGADIGATDAWDLTTGVRDVVIAYLDTGLDFGHPDLASNLWSNPGEVDCSDGVDNDNDGYVDDCRGWNFVAATNDPQDDNGHGSHVAGIAGAAGNNSTGVSGLMWQVSLMPLKILDADGNGTVADEVAAISYAVSKGAKVLNASFGGSEFSSAERDAIQAANAKGVLLVAAAGNGDDGIGLNDDLVPEYPAGYELPNIISVAATDRNDRLASFSNYGPHSVHVAAPGVDILSTYAENLSISGYKYLSGTSMSTPHVSGLAGLLLSYYPHFTSSQVRGAILRYVDELPTLQGSTFSGGRIDAWRSLSSLRQPSDFTAVATMNGIGLGWTDNATGEDGYFVERKNGSGTYTRLASISQDATSYSDSSFVDGTIYDYRLKAFANLPNPPSAAGTVAESEPAETAVSIPLDAPSGLAASAVSSSEVALTWVDNSRGEDGYHIRRAAAGGGLVLIASTKANVSSFVDTGVSPSETYIYAVSAFNASMGDSAASNEVTVTTPTAETPTGGGGGGGCSVGGRQPAAESLPDAVFYVLPPVAALLYRRHSGKKTQ